MINVNAVLDPVSGGGAAERTIQMSRALRDAGVSCGVMTTDIGLSTETMPDLSGIRAVVFRCLLRRFFIPLARYKSIKKVVGEADVVHLMGHWTVLNALTYLAARSLRKPYVVCPAGALPIYGRSKLLKRFYNLAIGRRIISDASAWIAITPDELPQFESYGIRKELVTVIPNGINPADYSSVDATVFRDKHGLARWPVVLFLGRLNSIKGPDLLLDAFCQGQHLWPEWRLVMAGPDGGMLSALENIAKRSPARDRIHFTGYVGGAEKTAAYQAADILVIPSRHEAMSIVVLESGITGTPVLITDRCGFGVIEEIGGGKVVPATVDGLLAGLAELSSDRELLHIQGERLRKYVQEHYTWDVIVNRYISLYNRILMSSRQTI